MTLFSRSGLERMSIWPKIEVVGITLFWNEGLAMVRRVVLDAIIF